MAKTTANAKKLKKSITITVIHPSDADCPAVKPKQAWDIKHPTIAVTTDDTIQADKTCIAILP